jgi:hypothetical protein
MNMVACAKRNYPCRRENCATANDEDAFALNIALSLSLLIALVLFQKEMTFKTRDEATIIYYLIYNQSISSINVYYSHVNKLTSKSHVNQCGEFCTNCAN